MAMEDLGHRLGPVLKNQSQACLDRRHATKKDDLLLLYIVCIFLLWKASTD